MRMPLVNSVACSILLLFAGLSAAAMAQTDRKAGEETWGLGSTPSEDLIEAWNIDVSPAGDNLPGGSGSVAAGKAIYAERCIACHGDQGQGGPMDRLVGGQGTLASDKPVKTVGSYWPYASTLFDYVHRAMPFDSPQSLTPDQVYAVSAYILNMNGILPDDAVLDRNSLPEIRMPNSGDFDPMDTVTKAKSEACMDDCPLLAVDVKGSTPTRIDRQQVQ